MCIFCLPSLPGWCVPPKFKPESSPRGLGCWEFQWLFLGSSSSLRVTVTRSSHWGLVLSTLSTTTMPSWFTIICLYPVVPQHLSIKLQSLILEPKLSTDVSIRPARFLCVTLPWTPSLLLYYTLLLCAWLSQGPTPWILPSVPGFYRICAQSVLPCLCLGGGGHAGPCLPRMVPAALPHLASAACEALTPCLGPSC